MSTLRERIRKGVPGSTQIFEHVVHLRRRRSSRAEIRQLVNSQEPLLLDIGGGGRPGRNGWITVDTAQGCDL